MSLIVEDGTGVDSANSFISVASAGSYLGTRSDTWTNASTVEQENALIEAGIYLNSLNWKGIKYGRDQYMAFPRYRFRDEDGYLYDYNVVPRNVTYANAEAAVLLLDNYELMPSVKPSDLVKRKKIDVLETEYFARATTGKTSFAVLDALLRGFLISAGRIARS